MNKFAKRLAVGTMCATMVIGSTVSVFAADADVDTTTLPEGSSDLVTGSGALEGYVTLDVTKVVLPTAAVTDDFKIDPQGLLYKADSSKFGTSGAAVYFTKSDSTYADTSDEITIKNKSSYAIDVTLAVGLTNGSNEALSQIKLVEKDALTDAKDPSLYFGVVSGSDTTAITKDGQTVKASAKAVPEVDGTTVTEGYELKATNSDPSNGTTVSPSGYYYYYDLTSGYTPGTDQIITFKLTGATNGVEGWKDVTETVSAKITYTIAKHVDSYCDKTSVSSTDNIITITNADVTVSSVSITKLDSTEMKLTSGTQYTYAKAKGTVTLSAAGAMNANVGGTINITYSDGKVDTLEIVAAN
jgi:hypothetical protein